MPGYDYHVLEVSDTAVGGVMTMPHKGRPVWGCYVTVDDVDAVARRAAELGGTVIEAPRDISGVGRSAAIADPQGATLNVITDAASVS